MGDEQARGDDDLVRDEEDHDLLTFSESAIRLREEIELTQAALREDPDPERQAVAQRTAQRADRRAAPQHQASAGQSGRKGLPRLRSPAPGRR